MIDDRDWRLPENRREAANAFIGQAKGMTLAYSTVHRHLFEQRGPASNYVCPCGQPAVHWAWQHTGIELTDNRGRTFSENIADFLPMCRSCHFKLDIAQSPKKAAAMARAIQAAASPEAHAKSDAANRLKRRTPEQIERYRAMWTPERKAAHSAAVKAANARKAALRED